MTSLFQGHTQMFIKIYNLMHDLSIPGSHTNVCCNSIDLVSTLRDRDPRPQGSDWYRCPLWGLWRCFRKLGLSGVLQGKIKVLKERMGENISFHLYSISPIHTICVFCHHTHGQLCICGSGKSGSERLIWGSHKPACSNASWVGFTWKVVPLHIIKLLKTYT